ncbi:ubiquitin thioesterase [Acrasis kona]|uniref:Ubiquitin thioesterase n=1 Tax=Acrasis kona TaxID=1008807 RepID=A0AAW2ZFZ1_9EUKA
MKRTLLTRTVDISTSIRRALRTSLIKPDFKNVQYHTKTSSLYETKPPMLKEANIEGLQEVQRKPGKNPEALNLIIQTEELDKKQLAADDDVFTEDSKISPDPNELSESNSTDHGVFSEDVSTEIKSDPAKGAHVGPYDEDTLVEKIVKANFPNGEERDEDLLLLKKNRVRTLKQWQSLSANDKKDMGTPKMLEKVLDAAAADTQLMFGKVDAALNFFESNIGKKEQSLVTSFGYKFPLINRSDSIKRMLMVTSETITALTNQTVTADKQLPLMHASAGPGTGKSRLLQDAIPQMIEMCEADASANPDTLNYLKGCVQVLTSFGNGNDLKPDEVLDQTSLSIRMLYKYFKVSANLPHFRENVIKAFGTLPTVDQAVTIIASHHRKMNKMDDNNTILMYLAIDEYNKLGEDLNKVFMSVSGYLIPHNGVIVLPVFGGTSIKNMDKTFSRSTRKGYQLMGSMFSVNDLYRLTQKLCEMDRYKFLHGWDQSRKFLQLVQEATLPRVYEILIQGVEANIDKGNLIDCLNNPKKLADISNKIDQEYSQRTNIPDALLPLLKEAVIACFLDDKLTRDQKNRFNALVELGISQISDRDRLVTPGPLLSLSLQHFTLEGEQWAKDMQQLLNMKVEKGEQLEEYHLKYLVLANNLRCEQGLKEQALIDVFRGCKTIMNKDVTIKLETMSYIQQSNQTRTKSGQAQRMEDNGVVVQPMNKMIRNGSGASAAYGHGFYNTKSNPLIVYIQHKLRESDAKSKDLRLASRKDVDHEKVKALEGLDIKMVLGDNVNCRSVFVYFSLHRPKDDFEPKSDELLFSRSEFKEHFGGPISEMFEWHYSK